MPIASPIARHQVREEIQRRILSGESRPGERLTQQSLARELGVAQGTVRESLLELQWLGLVESVDRLGVFVGKLDAARLCEAYQVREFLEGLARSACLRACFARRRDRAQKNGGPYLEPVAPGKKKKKWARPTGHFIFRS